jgi:GT2 family glycosyltransferase
MKTLIAIPCMDTVATGFCESLAMLKKVGECYVTHLAGSLIYDSRYKIAAKAIELGTDYLMCFDSDMIFQPDTLERLMAHDKDIVSGLYFRRTGTYRPVIFDELDVKDGKAVHHGMIDYPKDEIFKVAGVGFGCVLVKTEVLLDMIAAKGDWFTPFYGMGEDLAFCYRAREMGYDIWVDPTIKCGHVGNVVCAEEFYDAYKFANDGGIQHGKD